MQNRENECKEARLDNCYQLYRETEIFTDSECPKSCNGKEIVFLMILYAFYIIHIKFSMYSLSTKFKWFCVSVSGKVLINLDR